MAPLAGITSSFLLQFPPRLWGGDLEPGARGPISAPAYGAHHFMWGGLAYAFFYYVGHQLWQRWAEPIMQRVHGRQKAATKKFDFIARLGAIFHASFVAYMTLQETVQTDILSGWTATFSPQLQGVVALSCAWFMCDLIACCVIASEYSLKQVGGLETFLHHVTSMLAQTAVLVFSGPKLLTAGLLWTEATTPLVNARWYVLTFGLTGWPLQVMNVVMVLGFMAVRMPICTLCITAIYTHLPALLPPAIEWQLSAACIGTVSIITVLNYYWMYLMLSGITKGGKAAQKTS
jgi:hypothetical protein